MTEITFDIEGLPYYITPVWEVDTVPNIGDMIRIDKCDIKSSSRNILSKMPMNEAFEWADEYDDRPVLDIFGPDTWLAVEGREWRYDAETEEMECFLKLDFIRHDL